VASKIINIPMDQSIIAFASDYLENATDKTAVLSGGRRPFLFIKKNLAKRKQKAFYPPKFLSINDFVEQMIFDKTEFAKIPDLEAAYILFEIIKKDFAKLLKGKDSFADFLSWSLEILLFIEQLDLEKVPNFSLDNIKANADIGYDVPQNINELLKNLSAIRQSFHNRLVSLKQSTTGFAFLQASKLSQKEIVKDYDELVLLAPFYLHKTEFEIFKNIFDEGKLTIIISGDPNEYESLKHIYAYFKQPLPKPSPNNLEINFEVFAGFDDQSQAVIVKNLIKDVCEKDLDKHLIVLADEALISPITAEIACLTQHFNISAGYPISKTALWALVEDILKVQLSRQNNDYYLPDLIKVLTNPLVKNMRFFGDPALTRAVVHGFEQSFDPYKTDSLAGKLFLEIDEIISNPTVLNNIGQIAKEVKQYTNPQKLKSVLKIIFDTLFTDWQKPKTLNDFSKILLSFIDKVLELSIVDSYQLNAQCAQILIEQASQFQNGQVANLIFPQEQIINIFLDLVKPKKISLLGSPLKGLQILGVLESRSLSFETVYMVGMSDGAMPAVSKTSPLIPKDISFALGIQMAKKEFEIQKYHFNSIIVGAKKVNLIYAGDEKNERSRFIEKLIWDKQKKQNSLDAVKIKKLIIPYDSAIIEKKIRYEKTPEIKNFLKNDISYSFTMVDTYLKCILKFYFKHVLGLNQKDDIDQEPSAKDIGNFIHKFLQKTFFENFPSSKMDEPDFINNALADLDKLFEKEFALMLRDDAFLVKKIIDYKMKNLLNFEKQRPFESVFGCEKKYEGTLTTLTGTYKFKCMIDRIDKTDFGYKIMDYKTGAVPAKLSKKNFDALTPKTLSRQTIKKTINSLQLPIYKYLFEANEDKFVSDYFIYDIKKSELVPFLDLKDADYFNDVYKYCIDILRFVVDEINSGDYFEFDPSDIDECPNCPFVNICR
jgi:hypothetical protein